MLRKGLYRPAKGKFVDGFLSVKTKACESGKWILQESMEHGYARVSTKTRIRPCSLPR